MLHRTDAAAARPNSRDLLLDVNIQFLSCSNLAALVRESPAVPATAYVSASLGGA
jgi:hypothetical protein